MKHAWMMGLVAVLWVGCGDTRPLGPPDAGTDDTYRRCNTSSDCADSRDECWLVQLGPAGTSGRFCSSQCVTDFDCDSNFGFSGACYSLEGTNFLCYQRCSFDSDCYVSSVCVEVARTSGGTDFICVPDN